jgi:hypothetical protein
MSTKPPKVFLDANVLISAGKPPGGPEISRVRDLVEADLIAVLTTDLTVVEVAKHHAKNDLDIMGEITAPHFRKLVEQHTGVKLHDLKKGALKAQLGEHYRSSTRSMMKSLKAEELTVDSVKPSTILDAYADGTGFFEDGVKKDQFPDAFAFESLRLIASEKQPVIVVSADNDFKKPTANEKHISLVGSFLELFEHLGLQHEAPEVENWLEAHADELVALTDSELDDWGLQGSDVEDSEIDETNVTAVKLERVTAFKPIEAGDPILVFATITATTTVSYSHPDWDNASYDSEDKVLIPWDTVNGESEIEIEIDVSLTIAVDENGEPEYIEELSFRNDRFVYVELHPHDPYEYM